jgi:hypothetical protein
VRTLRLKRAPSAPYGTVGALLREDGSRVAWALELPWRDNVRGESCIPAGRYLCVDRLSPKFGRAYEVVGVPGRSNILVHAGNHAGRPSPPLESDVLGCVLLGTYLGTLRGQLAVLVSRPAVAAFRREMAGQPFWLEVSWASSTS